MALTTTYDVITNYKVRDDSRAPLMQIQNQVTQVDRSAGMLSKTLGKVGMMVAGAFGVGQAKKSLLDFNSGMEQAQIQMAGLMEQAGSGNFVGNMDRAATLVKQMQLDARASVGTTQDFVRMASMLVQPLTMAGGSMETLRDMTKQSVVASQSMGIAADVAARDVDQAIRGQYHSIDQFTSKLLTPKGFGGEEGRRKFNQMSMQDRLATVKSALNSPAIAAMAKAQETSFAGVTSTLVDTFQMTLGKVGMPLFKGITKEVQRWNEWLDKNDQKISHMAGIVGNKLLQAAISFRDAFEFAAKHFDKIVVGYGALKAAGYLANAGQAGGALMGGAAGLSGGAMGIGGKIAAVSLVASVVYIGGKAIADWIDGQQTKSINEGPVYQSLTTALEKFRQGDAEEKRKQAQFINSMSRGVGLNPGESDWMKVARDMDRDQLAATSSRFGTKAFIPELGKTLADTFASALVLNDSWKNAALMIQKPFNMMDGVAPGVGALAKPIAAKVNVTVNRIEVASDDPDRWAFRFVDAARDAGRNPSGASAGIRALATRGG